MQNTLSKMLIQRLAIFGVAVVVCAIAPDELRAADSEVSGVFNGNDQPAKLSFVSAQKGERFAGKDVIKLVFTEKDHSKDAQPDLNALFGHFGSALIVGIHPDGNVVSCDIVHQALKQVPISSPTGAKMTDFKNESGQISGKLVSDGKQEAFGQTWEINLAFKTKAP
ncbi:MAG TPA: hypothetical protein VKE30_00795 [Chthoniobacterales bacterium]|nr:hypothetical protein [Chthoniobacterales bacterium]